MLQVKESLSKTQTTNDPSVSTVPDYRQLRIADTNKAAKQTIDESTTLNDFSADIEDDFSPKLDTSIPNYRQLHRTAVAKSIRQNIETEVKNMELNEKAKLNYRLERIKTFQEDNLYTQIFKPKFLRFFEIKDLQNLLPATWKCRFDNEFFKKGTFIKHVLSPLSIEYQQVQQKFASPLLIKKIERVENPFLWLMYQFRKVECQLWLGSQELQLFHGTRTQNVDPICSENFNWRFAGRSHGTSYGHGVYFAQSSSTSSSYCSRVMFLARVLFARMTHGGAGILIPNPNCDCSGQEGSVYVKYDDFEYYPEYIIHF